METVDKEQIVMELIVNGGDARSKAMHAIKLAKKGDLQAAKDKIKEANEALNKAHNFQTSLIQSESAGDKVEISLLMIHAQDHLMNAITVRDLAQEMISMYEEFRK
ncbi:PTS lactose/cellobiose transporter subunit IIA [Clostridium sp. YIM B02505]|uniref:PTS lactose/cellobiose transporter subunit IIA n=1 Tax=Clostridium yunnanense TaxID=2800325 RepID=A0ABS1EKS6_9CLOT|nr:PTS lactose/cellobiose transporter subunit IIA [Clostridium yunnanense]MBK1809954.1 PTS lactose/cellobiose transporter subunit IIA [Clostridium yunnanense]